MEKLKTWPPVLFRKWLLTCVIGIGCLLVGIVMFLAAGDRVMLMISGLLALMTALRSVTFFRLVSKQAYETVEGVCIGIKKAPLRKQRSLCLLTESGAEHTITLDKQTPVRISNCYRAYFQPSGTASEAAPLQSFLAQDQFLALEDLGEYRAGAEDDPEKNSEACGN